MVFWTQSNIYGVSILWASWRSGHLFRGVSIGFGGRSSSRTGRTSRVASEKGNMKKMRKMGKWGKLETSNMYGSCMYHLAMHLVEVLAQICVLLSTFRTLQLKQFFLRTRRQFAKLRSVFYMYLVSFMNQPYMLSEITVLLSTNRTWRTTLKWKLWSS